ncbi:endonuclease domain-containing 1 protein-like [Pristis pectinata]|uniref:endonuclease domain-containing 1 protein-like n=1 Tax=Pristis pectinata TaxID=685728 RepID=UPI00223CD294|nr:endonuclease domain-containing 1 protein-like [Pristis pectinata]
MAMGLGGLLWFLLLAISHPRTVQGEVVENFQKCDSFFRDHTPPQGFDGMDNLVRICQRYKNRYHFATLYRTDLRIPVYSAYTYKTPSKSNESYRPCAWFYEPQIDDPKASADMKSSKGKTSNKQAVHSDYMNTSYERGHLYPYTFNEGDSATASCTLTNAIPKTGDANKKWYHYAERPIKILAENCHNSGSQMYLVTGSAEYTGGTMNNKVVVPGLIWTAVCCNSLVCQNNFGSPTTTDFSIAFMKELLNTNDVIRMMVPDLERRLNLENVRIFNQCRGTNGIQEQQTYQEVITLLNNITEL